MGFTGFYWVLLGFTGFYWVSLGFTGFYCVSLGLNGFHWVSLVGSARKIKTKNRRQRSARLCGFPFSPVRDVTEPRVHGKPKNKNGQKKEKTRLLFLVIFLVLRESQ